MAAQNESADAAQGEIARLSGVCKSFGARQILQGVTLEAPPGKITVVLGGSGCGKSTTLRILLGLESYDAGSVRLLGRELKQLSARERNALMLQPGVGVLFQFGALFDSMTVEENVAFALRHVQRLPEKEIRARCEEKLQLVGMENTGGLKPAQLSGGMRKRAALARALAHEPRILFVDEPTTGLDPLMSATINALILRLNKQLGVTVLCITHDISAAFSLADHMALLAEGRICAAGTPEQMRANQAPEVRRFLDAGAGAHAGTQR